MNLLQFFHIYCTVCAASVPVFDWLWLMWCWEPVLSLRDYNLAYRVINELLDARGMRHTSTALYFYGASKMTLHKPRVTFGNLLFQICYSLIYYLQLLCWNFLSKAYLNFKKLAFGIKIVLFLKSLLYHFTTVKIVHLQNNTFTD